MSPLSLHARVYLANAVVLLCHQIEAAYWHEWRLFHMPGGIELFVILNIPMVWFVVLGAVRLSANAPTGRMFSGVLAFAGLFAFCFHSFHLLRGDEAFTLPISLALLGATLCLSLAQVVFLVRERKA